QKQTNRVLDKHVDSEKDEVVLQRTEEPFGPQRFGEQALIVRQADERQFIRIGRGKQAQSQRVQQRVDHKRGIDDDRRSQKDNDVDWERLATLVSALSLHGRLR